MLNRTWRVIPIVLPRRSLATSKPTSTSPFVGEDAISKREQKKAKPVSNKVFQLETLNPHILEAKYAVRGEVLIKAEELRKQLETDPKSLPFDEIIYCNIGNPQQLGQKPITFFRQVLALVECPWLLSRPEISNLFARDAVSRAQQLISSVGSVGAYSNTQGFEIVREQVADFIARRDGFPSSPSNIFLSDGASPAVQSALKILIRGPQDGVMIPVPQYPLYSASLRAFNGSQIDYYLDEDNSNWGLQIDELERSYQSAKDKNIVPRGLVIINPGNPTGQCLPKDNMVQIVKFCVRNKLALFADEVYQENVYNIDRPFHSFKKVAMELGTEAKDLELLSFHSISKGFIGECGHRGGYVEMHNISSDVQAVFYKLASISLCPNVIGQSLVGLMVNPPKEGDESYPLYRKEKEVILSSLIRRANKLVTALNNLEGVKCNPVEGAMYVFPRITLSQKAINAANEAGQVPDVYYSMELLKATGICVVAGSGFGQREGTWHFRTTILPLEDQIDQVIEKLSAFHKKFMAKYRG